LKTSEVCYEFKSGVCLEEEWSGLRENVVQLTKSGVHLAMKNGVCFEKEGSVFGERGVLWEEWSAFGKVEWSASGKEWSAFRK